MQRISSSPIVPVLAYDALQTSHVTPQQAGAIFTAAQPRLAVAHHLTVNDASRAAIIQDIRQGYTKVRGLLVLQLGMLSPDF